MAPRIQPEQLRTVQFVPLTAFDANDQLNLDPMRTLVGRLVAAVLRALIPCAGSSEFHSLSIREIAEAIEMVRLTVDDDVVVMAPTGQAIHHALELSRETIVAGADCVLVMPLGFPYLSDAGAEDYYLRLLEELDRPVLIYKKDNVPSDDLLLRLADHPNMIGVKYAVNDVDAFTRVVQDDGGRIDWFCGSAERFAPFFMLAGATGYTSGAGNLCPRLTLAMHAAASSGNWAETMRLLRQIRPIEDFRAQAASSYNISFLKQAIRSAGLDFGAPRPPQRRLSDDERREADEVAAAVLAAEEQMMHSAAAS